jgi:hypothetical protein
VRSPLLGAIADDVTGAIGLGSMPGRNGMEAVQTGERVGGAGGG